MHGKVYVVSAYQYRPLSEIAQMIEDELIDMHDLEVFQSWVMREEHFDQENHEENIESLESQWPDYSAEEHQGLCTFPQYLCSGSETQTLWDALAPEAAAQHTEISHPSIAALREKEVVTTRMCGRTASAKAAHDEVHREAKTWKKKYESDAQFVLSRTNHHMHVRVKKGDEIVRVPLAACKPKNKSDVVCKHGLPMCKQLNKRGWLVSNAKLIRLLAKASRSKPMQTSRCGLYLI